MRFPAQNAKIPGKTGSDFFTIHVVRIFRFWKVLGGQQVSPFEGLCCMGERVSLRRGPPRVPGGVCSATLQLLLPDPVQCSLVGGACQSACDDMIEGTCPNEGAQRTYVEGTCPNEGAQRTTGVPPEALWVWIPVRARKFS